MAQLVSSAGFARILVFWAMIVLGVIALDQWIKWQIIAGFTWESETISIVLVYNTGVAFSMLAFLQGWLKWLQIALLVGIVAYFMYGSLFKRHWVGLGFIVGGGVANVIDRFVHGAVVDYVYWHYWFEFAIFNFADVCIDIGVGILLVQWLLHERKSRKEAKA